VYFIKERPMQLILIAVLGLMPDAEPDAEVRKLQTELVKTLQKAIAVIQLEYEAGRRTTDEVVEFARPLRDAELAIATVQADRIAAHLRYFKSMVTLDKPSVAKFEAGRISFTDYLKARVARIEAEIGLRKAGGMPPKGTKPLGAPKLPKRD
jgi:outer membrane protein TolC